MLSKVSPSLTLPHKASPRKRSLLQGYQPGDWVLSGG